MLKGCDGINVYDTKIRACPASNIQTNDILTIHKIGHYPTFTL